MKQYIVYDLATGVTTEIATTQNIDARVGSSKGYIDLVEGFPPRLVGITKIVSGEIHPYEPEVSEDQKWRELRLRRDSLLAKSDWTQVEDAPVDKDLWREYRQKLRDITEQDINHIVWPKRP